MHDGVLLLQQIHNLCVFGFFRHVHGAQSTVVFERFVGALGE